ncbi:MAG: dockerin type I domain-containing protein [Pirellulales bacterium]
MDDLNQFTLHLRGAGDRAGKRTTSKRKSGGARRRRTESRFRRLAAGLETLETRNLLASLPFGAMPDDTGEYMLGDVVVNVVLFESDSSLAPFDTNTYPEENWTGAQIAAVKQKVENGVNWWKDTLHNVFPQAPSDILNFQFDYTYADSPVHTGYEPIARWSGDFGNYVYDFLTQAGFAGAATGNSQSGFVGDLKAFNNAKRLEHNADWSFTIFVVNDANDADGMFAAPPPNVTGFRMSFAYSGGVAIVMPASRPDSTVAHEMGHQFWALDEYDRTSTWYSRHRGYYNTYNTNANPSGSFTPQDSIMSGGASMQNAYAQHVSSTPSLEMIGWKDTDNDGIFDVLDVPHALDGFGSFDANSRSYTFHGTSQVQTLKNLNSESLQNDITINRIRQAQYSENNGPWIPIASYNAYSVTLDLDIPISVGTNSLRIRTFDTRTGVASEIFTDNFTQPVYPTEEHGISGYVFNDLNNSGDWNTGEKGLEGWQVSLVDQLGGSLNLHHVIDADSFTSGQAVDGSSEGVTFTAFGTDVATSVVFAKQSFSASTSGKAFANNSIEQARTTDLWTTSRRLRAGFDTVTSTVSIDVYGTGTGTYGRLEAYDSQNRLLDRVTTSLIAAGDKQTVTISRAQGDISYIVAFGHAGTTAVLDHLDWGSETSTTTDTEGRYSFGKLGPGTYVVHVTPQSYYQQTFPQTVDHLVQVVNFAQVNNLNFGFKIIPNAWRNPNNPLDVSRDGSVSPVDALTAINWLNNNPTLSALAGVPGATDGLVDVNGDGSCSPADVLMVINYLNLPPASSFTTLSVPSGNSSSGTGGTSTSSGESGSVVATLPVSNTSVTADGEANSQDSASLFTGSLALYTQAGDPQALANAYRAAGFVSSNVDFSSLDPHRGGCTCGSCLSAPLEAHIAGDHSHEEFSSAVDSDSDLGNSDDDTLALLDGEEDDLLGTLAMEMVQAKQKARVS